MYDIIINMKIYVGDCGTKEKADTLH